jgi:hypothetical protein
MDENFRDERPTQAAEIEVAAIRAEALDQALD